MTAYHDAAAAQGVALLPMTDDDLPFCDALYASTRAEEVAQTGWPIEAQRQFLFDQHRAQHSHYRLHYPNAEWWIIARAGERIGRLYLMETRDDLRVVDIALLPQGRGHGIGGALLSGVQRHAAAAGKSVSLHIERNNPARSLYDRLGFVTADSSNAVYDRIEWRAA